MSFKLPPPPPGLPGSRPGRSKTFTVPEWATNIPERSPVFKVHENRGHALNALYERPGQLLRLNQSKSAWEIVCDTTPLYDNNIDGIHYNITNCQDCGKSLWEIGYAKSKYLYRSFRWEFSPDIHLVVCCSECKRRGGPPAPEEKLEEVVEQAVAEGAAATAASDAVLDEALKDEVN